MPLQAPAVVLTAPGEVEVCDVPVPDPRPDEVLVRTEYSLISNGTEKWVWSGRFHSPGRQPGTHFPWVPGYQRVGIVEHVGADVTHLKPGQRVACTVSRFEGEYASSWGSHASLAVTHGSQCFPVPEDLDPIDVSGLVLTQVGFNGGTRPPVQPGWNVVVIGDGLVGQWAAQTFRAQGANVVLCGRRPRRLDIAASISADIVINGREQDLVTEITQKFPEGVDCVDESVGLIANVESAFVMLRHDGHLVFNGYHPEGEHLLNIQLMHDKEITCWGMAGWTTPRMEKTLQWVCEGKLKVRELVTHEFSGAEADKAYRLMWDKSDDFLGILLNWK